MGINRISSSFLSDQAIFHLQNNLTLLSGMQERISSGKNINRPSDDPVGMTRIVDLGNTLNLDDRFKRNIESGLAELRVTDTSLAGVTDILHRARELTTQGATATINTEQRLAISLEVDHMIDELVQLSNTRIGGKYIFSGMRTSTATYTRTNNDIIFNGNPLPDDFQREVEVATGVNVGINFRGLDIFGDVTTAPGPPESVSTGSGLFETMMELKLNLEQDDPDQVRLRLDELQADLENVLRYRADVGATTNRLEMTMNRIEERKAVLTQQFASIQEVDMASAISDLNFQENVFQASLGASARVIQPSLLQFLR